MNRFVVHIGTHCLLMSVLCGSFPELLEEKNRKNFRVKLLQIHRNCTFLAVK